MDRFIQALGCQSSADVQAAAGEAGQRGGQRAPHTARELAGEWSHPYTRGRRGSLSVDRRVESFFPYVSKIDNGYGDRNLCCRNCE